MFFKSVRRKIEKYERQFRPLVWGTSFSCIFFTGLVLVYFFPTVLYSKYGFLKVNEKTLQDILQVSFTVVGVVFGVFLQQLLEFLIVPDKEVLHPLNKKSLFPEFFFALEEFYEKLKKDEKNLLDDPETNVTILLSSPVLVDFDEIPKILGNRDHKTRYETLVNDIFNSNKKFGKRIVCLDISPSQQQGLSPMQRFIKSFSGFIISELHKDIKDKENLYYRDVDAFRKNITYKVREFCNSAIIKKHIRFAKEDDLQWQAIVIKAPQIRFYKAVVGFYGEDFFKKNSFLGLMNEIKQQRPMDYDNQGFVSDAPDIVELVMDGLVNPYISDKDHPGEFIVHHSSGVHDKITREKPSATVRGAEESVMIDNSKTLETIKVTYEHGPDSILKEIEYPVYDGTTSKPIKIKYCQYLFHPLIAESATWSSLNIRILGEKRVLDMCCGIGVQGLASIDKGATFVHGVDSDPISLLCAIENYKRKVNNKQGIQVSVTLSEGFEKVKAKTFNEFEEMFRDTLNNSTWNGILNDQRKKELLGLFESNRVYAEKIYKGCISKDFDIILLEPPFVEFSEDEISPSHDSLYDKHFVVTRSLLMHARDYLKQPQNSEDWEKPYVMQSFSSLESIIELENYIDEKGKYKIFRKSCIEKNGVHWYCYHLIPIVD